jgi:hypothetical protein
MYIQSKKSWLLGSIRRFMEEIKTGRVDIKDCTMPELEFKNMGLDEEISAHAKQLIQEFELNNKLQKYHELNKNLGQLQDLLDFNTYSAYRFEFEEKEAFTLEHIVGLIRTYKINNEI